MAYFLRKTATTSANAVVSTASLITFVNSNGAGWTGNWRIKFKVQMAGTSLPLLSGLWTAGGGVNPDNIVFFTTTTNLQLRSGNNQRNVALPQPATGLHEYELIGSSATNNISVYQSGVFCGAVTGASLFTSGLGSMLSFANSSRTGDLYYVEIYNNGVLQHNYDPSASNGTGTTLIDTVSGNNGTLINFPSDNSQWVFYDDGGEANQSTVGYDLSSIGFAVSSQVSAPANAASIGYDLGAIGYAIAAQQIAPGNAASVAYDIGETSFAVSAQQQAPQINALIGYDVGAIGFDVSAQQSAPQLTASVGYEIGGIGFAVQVNTGSPINTATATYELGGIGYSVSSQSVAPQLSASLAYDIGGIDYAVSANTGAPIRAAAVGYELGDISWQVNAQWQPSDATAIIGYDIGSIGFLVQARSGDVVVSSATDAGLSFKELARGLPFKEQPRGIKFTEPPRGVRI